MDSLQAKFVGKFYGPHEIKDITVRKGHIFNVTLDDEQTIPLTEKAIIAIVTDEKNDYNHIRKALFDVLVPEIVNVIRDYDVSVSDINALFQEVGKEIDGRFARATNFLWTKDDKRFIPGFSVMDSVTLLMAEEVIDNILEHDNGKGDGDTAS
jgi:hypothetical protein